MATCPCLSHAEPTAQTRENCSIATPARDNDIPEKAAIDIRLGASHHQTELRDLTPDPPSSHRFGVIQAFERTRRSKIRGHTLPRAPRRGHEEEYTDHGETKGQGSFDRLLWPRNKRFAGELAHQTGDRRAPRRAFYSPEPPSYDF